MNFHLLAVASFKLDTLLVLHLHLTHEELKELLLPPVFKYALLQLTACVASASSRLARMLCKPLCLARRNFCACRYQWPGRQPHTAPAGTRKQFDAACKIPGNPRGICTYAHVQVLWMPCCGTASWCPRPCCCCFTSITPDVKLCMLLPLTSVSGILHILATAATFCNCTGSCLSKMQDGAPVQVQPALQMLLLVMLLSTQTATHHALPGVSEINGT